LQQFRAKIYPTLKAVRAEIVGSTQPGEGSAAAQEVTAILLEQEAVTS